MSQEPKPKSQQPSKGQLSIKGPLIFSFCLGIIAGVITLVVATGGSSTVKDGSPRIIRWDLGFIAFGITVIASLVVSAMLALTYKENPEHLSQGSGVNLRSEDRLKAAAEASSTTEESKESGESPESETDRG